MPPKKTDAKKPEDDGPKVYIQVSVSWSTALVASGGEGYNLTYTFPGDKDPVQPDTAGVNNSGEFSRTFIRKQGLPLLHQLLNSPLVLKLCQAGSDAAVASASLDFSGFAQGLSSLPETALQLALVDGSQLALSADATVKVQVHLLQETGESRADPPAAAAKPAGKGAPPAPPPGLVDLSQLTLEPCALVPADQAAGGQVVQLSLQPLAPVPDTLQAAATAAGGALSFSCGLHVGGPLEGVPTCLVLPGGSLQDGKLMWPAEPIKFFLSGAAVKSFKAAVEDDLPMYAELARYLAPGSDAITDPAYEMYHGLIPLAVANELSQPGQQSANLQGTCSQSFLEAQQAGVMQTAGLPRPEPPTNAKAKPIEEAPAVDSVQCAWARAGTSIAGTIELQTPLYPPWQPPSQPAVTLQQLIPKREFVKQEKKSTPSQQFKGQIKAAARKLALEYHKMFGADEATLTASDPDKAASRRKQLVFELNRSGQYLHIKEQLKASVLRIVKEHYHKSGSMARDEMQELYNQLYIHLSTDMHTALNQLITEVTPAQPASSQFRPTTPSQGSQQGPDKGAAGLPNAHQLARLKGLADEAEIVNDVAAAERYHQERLVASTEPQVWYEYGCFCLRSQQQGKAEQCLREAVALDPTSKGPLLALASLLWHNGMHTDAAHLDQAETVLHAAKEASSHDACIWALLTLLYDSMGSRRASEHRNAAFETHRLAQAQQKSGAASNAYLQAALLLLDLQLGECAQKALQAASKEQADQGQPSLAGLELHLCCSRAASLVGDHEGALASAKEAARAADVTDGRPCVIMGNIHWAAQRHSQASVEYQSALRSDPTGCPLDLYLKLGTSFLAGGEFDYARNVYVQACAVRPCASTWLGAGIAYLRLQDFKNAEVALMEANILNNRHAEVWAYLALLALHTNQAQEAEQALKWALHCDLANAQLLDDIGEQYMNMGRYCDAQSVLRRSLALQDKPHSRWLLGDALTELSELQGAKAEYEAVLGYKTVSEAERTHATQQLAAINRRIGHTKPA